MRIIDCHIHCGNNRRTKQYDLYDIRKDLKDADADGAVIFAFPEDMYRIEDTPEWRIKANKYILEVSQRAQDIAVYPFYFVWNDYIIPEDLSDYAGIKWHRHWDEPRYDYDDPKCQEILKQIKNLNLPVLIEEEFSDTVRFVKDNPELNIIIPHMGSLNGGSEKMDILFDNPRIYFDTGTASLDAIKVILDAVGNKRVIYGSDVSGTRVPFFNFPKVELAKLEGLDLDEENKAMILGANIESLIPIKFVEA